MRRGEDLQTFSRRTPKMVVISLCATLLAYWADAVLWLPYGLAAALVGLAVTIMAMRDRQSAGSSNDTRETDWLTNELAGYGSPPGTYPLGFLAIVTLGLTGFDSAYSLPAWAALLLIAARAVAERSAPPPEQA